MKPIINFGDYTVCFEALPESMGMKLHFLGECGWTLKQYNAIKDCAWFCAKVSIWKDGEELACEYLGACSYKTEEEFYTKYVGDYFSDMVHTCAEEVKDPVLLEAVNKWRQPHIDAARARCEKNSSSPE